MNRFLTVFLLTLALATALTGCCCATYDTDRCSTIPTTNNPAIIRQSGGSALVPSAGF